MVVSRFRKRVRSNPFRRTVRRRLNFTRRRRRIRRTRGITNRTGVTSSIGRFRTSRVGRLRYRRMLWNSTLQKAHYRSLSSVSTAISTPNNVTTATLTIIQPGTLFWTAAGGAQPINALDAVPLFADDMIIRGGVSTLQVTNIPALTAPSDPVRVVVYSVWTNKDPAAFVFPGTVPLTWDPSCFTDFPRYGKVFGRQEALLKGDREVFEMFFRHRVQKVDRNIHLNGGSRLVWFVLSSQTSNPDGTAEQVQIVSSINYSFSADAT